MRAEVDLSRNPERLVELLPDGWAGSGALFRGLTAALRHLVDEGELAPGVRLPSERGLAAALALSRSTVVAAYDELRADGTLASRRGSGTRVAKRAGAAAAWGTNCGGGRPIRSSLGSLGVRAA